MPEQTPTTPEKSAGPPTADVALPEGQTIGTDGASTEPAFRPTQDQLRPSMDTDVPEIQAVDAALADAPAADVKGAVRRAYADAYENYSRVAQDQNSTPSEMRAARAAWDAQKLELASAYGAEGPYERMRIVNETAADVQGRQRAGNAPTVETALPKPRYFKTAGTTVFEMDHTPENRAKLKEMGFEEVKVRRNPKNGELHYFISLDNPNNLEAYQAATQGKNTPAIEHFQRRGEAERPQIMERLEERRAQLGDDIKTTRIAREGTAHGEYEKAKRSYDAITQETPTDEVKARRQRLEQATTGLKVVSAEDDKIHRRLSALMREEENLRKISGIAESTEQHMGERRAMSSQTADVDKPVAVEQKPAAPEFAQDPKGAARAVQQQQQAFAAATETYIAAENDVARLQAEVDNLRTTLKPERAAAYNQAMAAANSQAEVNKIAAAYPEMNVLADRSAQLENAITARAEAEANVQTASDRMERAAQNQETVQAVDGAKKEYAQAQTKHKQATKELTAAAKANDRAQGALAKADERLVQHREKLGTNPALSQDKVDAYHALMDTKDPAAMKQAAKEYPEVAKFVKEETALATAQETARANAEKASNTLNAADEKLKAASDNVQKTQAVAADPALAATRALEVREQKLNAQEASILANDPKMQEMQRDLEEKKTLLKSLEGQDPDSQPVKLLRDTITAKEAEIQQAKASLLQGSDVEQQRVALEEAKARNASTPAPETTHVDTGAHKSQAAPDAPNASAGRTGGNAHTVDAPASPRNANIHDNGRAGGVAGVVFGTKTLIDNVSRGDVIGAAIAAADVATNTLQMVKGNVRGLGTIGAVVTTADAAYQVYNAETLAAKGDAALDAGANIGGAMLATTIAATAITATGTTVATGLTAVGASAGVVTTAAVVAPALAAVAVGAAGAYVLSKDLEVARTMYETGSIYAQEDQRFQAGKIDISVQKDGPALSNYKHLGGITGRLQGTLTEMGLAPEDMRSHNMNAAKLAKLEEALDRKIAEQQTVADKNAPSWYHFSRSETYSEAKGELQILTAARNELKEYKEELTKHENGVRNTIQVMFKVENGWNLTESDIEKAMDPAKTSVHTRMQYVEVLETAAKMNPAFVDKASFALAYAEKLDPNVQIADKAPVAPEQPVSAIADVQQPAPAAQPVHANVIGYSDVTPQPTPAPAVTDTTPAPQQPVVSAQPVTQEPQVITSQSELLAQAAAAGAVIRGMGQMDKKPKEFVQAAQEQKVDLAKIFDLNKDGIVTKDEIKDSLTAAVSNGRGGVDRNFVQAHRRELDTNHDKRVTRGEVDNFMASVAADLLNALNKSGVVMHDGSVKKTESQVVAGNAPTQNTGRMV